MYDMCHLPCMICVPLTMYDMYAGDDHASIVICMELCDRGSLWAAAAATAAAVASTWRP